MSHLKRILMACAVVPAICLSPLTLPVTSVKAGELMQLAQAVAPCESPDDPACAKPPKGGKPNKPKPQAEDGVSAGSDTGGEQPKPVKPQKPKPQPQVEDGVSSGGDTGGEQPKPVKPQKPKPQPQAEDGVSSGGDTGGEQPKPVKPQKPKPQPQAEDGVSSGGDTGGEQPKPVKPQKPKPQPQVEDGVSSGGDTGGEQPKPVKPQKPKPQPQVEDGVSSGGDTGGEQPKPVKPQKPKPQPQVEDGVSSGGDTGGEQPNPVKPPKPQSQVEDNGVSAGSDGGAPETPKPDKPRKPTPEQQAEDAQVESGLAERLGDTGADAGAALEQSVNQGAQSIEDVKRGRRVFRNSDGMEVTVEPGGRLIVQDGDHAVIRHDDTNRLDEGAATVNDSILDNGNRLVVIVRPNGDRIRTLYAPNGMVLQRIREDVSGQTFVLFDNRMDNHGNRFDNGANGPMVLLPPPMVGIPQNQYRVEMGQVPQQYVEDAMTAPPVVPIEQRYSLNQVIYSPQLRARVRSVDLNTITFDSGSWMVDQSQAQSLEVVADGIHKALEGNANEVFLVEGYTDAVGSVVDNLSLSDRRAESVASVLTQYFNIPPENLVTQGYGESQLKVLTDGPERANRRVTVRRITPLLSTQDAN
ncbi:OmpA family protein [Oryzibacter oryziterrae]|uniref:OmpA family protein n=1 Tax=Oryzibacter oryziterrae TaxID=2766474 RepID=UPI001F1BF310|nr:OmpA family protein [Oryzibacter oryziterrae]